MEELIAICIPACNRPEFLCEAVESCLTQDYRPLEIIIGDDSDDAAAAEALRRLVTPDDVTLTYARHIPPRGQSGNVNWLFRQARADRLVLLHDDDLLCAGAIRRLVRAWDGTKDAACVYGRQVVIGPNGSTDEDRTAAWNERHTRTIDRAGPQSSALAAVLLQQMPNDGYLVSTKLARRVGLRPETTVGHCVDLDFGLRLALEAGSAVFVFLPEFISKYRLTIGSIARSPTLNRRSDLLFDVVKRLGLRRSDEAARHVLLGRIALAASLDAARAGLRFKALSIIFSRHFDAPRWSRWGLYRLLSVLSPRAAAGVRGLLRRTSPPTDRPWSAVKGPNAR